MPDNFVHLGVINLLFPNATIINAIRNPLDTCLSCYFQSFNEQPWSYDLGWISNRYHFYRKTMGFWKENLPEGRVIDFHYEQLIADPESNMKKLLNAIKLPWDDSCLEFYNNKQSINTASLWQARQPIYSSSIRRWSNYAEHLTPLANELIDFLDDEDIKLFEEKGIKLKKNNIEKIKGLFSSFVNKK